MEKVLYRKYRSKRLDEVIGQKHITNTLSNAIKTGVVSHAYLFTGPRGVGKTSVARILAHEINGLDYSDSGEHLDIIEIDAASNRRIEEVRELRDKIHVAPTSAKYKVYIIDEVHMLTTEAFNALLKTLEEPPAHVIFILATTETHKLPATIVSRTQRYTFKPINQKDIEQHLRQIASKENIAIEDDALMLIAEHGEGSFRDSISLLNQFLGIDKTVDESDVLDLLGLAPSGAIQELYNSIQSHDLQKANSLLINLREQGVLATTIAKQLSNKYRSMIISQKHDTSSAIRLLEALVSIPSSPDPSASLELVLFKYILESSDINNMVSLPPKTTEVIKKEIKEDVKNTQATPKHLKVTNKKSISEQKAEVSESTKPESNDESQSEISEDWASIISLAKAKHSTIYSVLRMATPEFDNNVMKLSFNFKFHQRQLNEPKQKKLIQEILQEYYKKPIDVRILAKETKTKSVTAENLPKPPKDNNDLKNISNIFGNSEVLES